MACQSSSFWVVVARVGLGFVNFDKPVKKGLDCGCNGDDAGGCDTANSWAGGSGTEA